MASERLDQVPCDDLGIARLSPRETEILCLLGGGWSNHRIAQKLDISERTVKAHITNVLTKLGLESRLQAGLFALTRGLGQFDPAALHAQRSHGFDSIREPNS
jgi:DNA-binding NarL/FixJ family response regulator